jgi:hypothetical protein
VLLEHRAKAKGRLKRKGSSTLFALAAEDASDFPSRVKAMAHALESPTVCYSASFRGFLQLITPHDPLDWKASFGRSVQLAIAPTEATPKPPTSTSVPGASDAAMASGNLIQEGTHGVVDDETASARTRSQETPLHRAEPSIDLIPTPSMGMASADRSGGSASNGKLVELPPRSP